MPRDPRDEALDKIQNIVNSLPVAYDLQAEVHNYLDIIEALARHRDNPSCVDTKDAQLRAKANRRMG
nr:hypothetical protein [uncultured bacterium]